MSDKKKYDSTVARIAGNIASGIIPRVKWETFDTAQAQAMAVMSVSVARLIIAEIESTEPEPQP